MPRLRHISSSQSQAGFTLIELLVVLSITVLLMMTVSIFFMTFVVGNTKAVFEQKLKQDGDQAMSQMSTMLRNARSLSSTCTTGLTSITFTGTDNLSTTLTGVTGKIASVSSITTPATNFYLISDFSALDPANIITFNCYESANAQKYVEIEFTLRRGVDSINSQTTLTRNFKTGVTLRNSTSN
jgi:prepilin-type N-terminal cleavage/methylation domain-containing protein